MTVKHSRRRWIGRMLALGAAIALAGGFAPATSTAAPDSGGTLDQQSVESYPRVIRLAHSGDANGTLLATYTRGPASTGEPGTTDFPVYQSDNNGQSWDPAGAVPIPGNHLGETLYELPKAAGDLPAGTILAAGAATDDDEQSIKVYASNNLGQDWTPRGTCAQGDRDPGNWSGHLYEPELRMADNGDLVCYYSSQKYGGGEGTGDSPRYGQLIMRTVSTDGGKTWTGEKSDVQYSDPHMKPGMATVTQIPNGDDGHQFAMTYERCSDDTTCPVYLKTSNDAASWDLTDGGTRIQTADGRYMGHTPYLTWSPAGGDNGTLIASAQWVYTPDGEKAPERGRVLFVNRNLGKGPWQEITSPVPTNPQEKPQCTGYSSPVLADPSSSDLFMMAGTYTGSDTTCAIKYAPTTLPKAQGEITGPGEAAQCLDVDGDSSVNNSPVQLYGCNDATGQQWSIESDGTIRAFEKCLSVEGDRTTNNTNVQLYDCNSTGGQKWSIGGDGTIVNPASRLCLDARGGATDDRTRLQIHTCNNTASQRWNLPASL